MAAENGHILTGYMNYYPQKSDKAYAAMPMWQLGLIYAADHPHKYGLNEANCGRLATYAYKYMNGDWETFNSFDFLKRIKKALAGGMFESRTCRKSKINLVM